MDAGALAYTVFVEQPVEEIIDGESVQRWVDFDGPGGPSGGRRLLRPATLKPCGVPGRRHLAHRPVALVCRPDGVDAFPVAS